MKMHLHINKWLYSMLFLIGLMVVIGGLTRMTGSGLSITKWRVASGIIPPLSMEAWQDYFQDYQKSSQYQQINNGINLAEFKQIFWLEYIHRLFGRITALAMLLPLIYFSLYKALAKRDLTKLWCAAILMFAQGLVGWYMVKSGLVGRVSVAPQMLAFHLVTAMIIFWIILSVMQKKTTIINRIFPFLIILQSGLGAVIAGSGAGLIYNNFPMMGLHFFPPLDDAMAIIQFMHRAVALTIFILAIAVCYFKSCRDSYILLTIVLLQITLGILTLIYLAPIWLALSHQFIALMLLTITIIHKYDKI